MSRNIFEDLQSPFPSAPAVTVTAPPAPGPSGEAPPPYSTLPATATPDYSRWLSDVGYSPMGMKLSYMDFVPRLVKKRMIGRDEYETFSAMLQRANTWLEEHVNIQLIRCETVTWFGASRKDIFSDNSDCLRTSGSMIVMRGLRFWYFSRLVPSPSHVGRSAIVLHCQTFPARQSESISQLMQRVNDQLAENTSIGRILSVETVRLDIHDGLLSTDLAVWKDDTTSSKHVLTAVRVFSTFSENPVREKIGYQDFIPEKTSRSRDNRGYELYSDVMERATLWIARQQGVRFTNLQTVPIKVKKQPGFEERCTFTEHGGRPTQFLNIVRAYYVIQQGSRPELPPARLTYRTFAPVQVAPATSNSAPKYEDVRTLLERVNHWLQLTGAYLFSLETLPVRIPTSGNMLGSNATFVLNTERSSRPARYLFNIRIVLNGDYMEPPAALGLVY